MHELKLRQIERIASELERIGQAILVFLVSKYKSKGTSEGRGFKLKIGNIFFSVMEG